MKRLVNRLALLVLLLPLCGCDRGQGSIDGPIRRSTAIYVARQRDDGYVITEIIREPAKHAGLPRVGDPAISRAYTLLQPHSSAPELVIMVSADASTQNFAQMELPVKNGRLVSAGITIDELRRRAAATPVETR